MEVRFTVHVHLKDARNGWTEVLVNPTSNRPSRSDGGPVDSVITTEGQVGADVRGVGSGESWLLGWAHGFVNAKVQVVQQGSMRIAG